MSLSRLWLVSIYIYISSIISIISRDKEGCTVYPNIRSTTMV